jgi:arylsulfatase A-like enzyme
MQRRDFVRTLALAALSIPLNQCGSSDRRTARRGGSPKVGGTGGGSVAGSSGMAGSGGSFAGSNGIAGSNDIAGAAGGMSGPSGPLNIVYIMADDHAAQAIGCYSGRLNQTPRIDQIARQGVRFDNCFCTNAICAPSRATILTGKYSHVNGLRNNSEVFDGTQATFPKLLQAAGYETALLGKWHLKSDPTGFDYWNVLPDQGDYYNPDLIEMGTLRRYPGYVTDILTDMAVDYLQARRDSSRPFLLMLQHKAPHRDWEPAERHLRLFDDVVFPEPPTLFDDYATRCAAASEQEMTIRDAMSLDSDLKLGSAPDRMNAAQRAAWEAAYAPKRDAFQKAGLTGDSLVRWKYQRFLQDYLGCIAAVDESVGRVLDVLDSTGLAGNTLVVYTSDQGFFLGEHGWFDKRFMYEEALRMPLVMRLPGTIPAGSVNRAMVTNADFGPTLLDVAGVEKPADMQGASFLPLLLGQKVADWPSSIYYHYYEYPAIHMAKRHFGIRTSRYKLIHFYYDVDAWELYDLEQDPHELNNVADDPVYAEIRHGLEDELVRRQNVYGDSEELAQSYVKSDLGI